MPFNLTNTANVTDDATLELDGPAAVATAVIGGTTYLYVGGGDDSGVSAFRVNADGSLTNVANVPAPAAVSSMTLVTKGGQTLLYVAGYQDQAVGSFNVAGDGTLVAIGGPTPLGFRPNSITSVVAGGQTYVFAGSSIDDTIKGFAIGTAGVLNALGGPNTFDSATALASAVVGGVPYLFSAARDNDSVRVFKVADNGALSSAGPIVTDDANLELDGAASLATAVVGGTTFLFVGGVEDDGVSVFRVDTDGSLTNTDNVTDSESADLRLDVVASLTTATIGGKTFLFAAGQGDNGVSVFAVGADGSLTHVANVADAGALELGGASAVTTGVVGGATFLFATGYLDDGVSAFLAEDIPPPPPPGVTITGTKGKDVVDATHSAKGQPLPTDGNDVISGLGNKDKLSGLGGDDIIDGGKHKDKLFGGLGADTFVFSASLKEKPDTIGDFAAADDTIQLLQKKFKKLDLGVLSDTAFRDIGEAATDEDRIVYKANGKLAYDKDGKGGADAIVFAKLAGAPDISNLDFLVA